MTRKSALIYLRVSSARQAAEELPIDSQLEQCQKKAAELDASVVRTFADKGISGREEDRPGFQDAIAFAEDIGVDYFICWSSSRFARDHIVAGIYKRRLAKRGVSLIYVSGDVGDRETYGGFVLDSILAVMDEAQSRQIAADTRRSLMKNSRDGFANGGNTPLGYRRVTSPKNPKRKSLEINLEEMGLVLQIFRWRAAGAGGRVIAERLNSSAQLNRGKKWAASTIHNLLRNPTVIGQIVYNRRGPDRRVQRDRADWIVVDAHEPIVPIELWDKVQAMIDEEKPEGAVARVTGLLFSGLLKCGHCNASMLIESAKGRSKRYHYYNCSTWMKSRSCQTNRRRADVMDGWLLDSILDKVFTAENLSAVAVELNRDGGKAATERKQKLKALNLQLADLGRRRSKLFEVLELHGRDAPNMGDLTVRLHDLAAQIKATSTEMETLASQPVPSFSAGDKEVEAIREVLNDIVRDKGDSARARTLLRRFIDHVVVYSDYVFLSYKTELLAEIPLQATPVHRSKKWLPGTGSNRRPSD